MVNNMNNSVLAPILKKMMNETVNSNIPVELQMNALQKARDYAVYHPEGSLIEVASLVENMLNEIDNSKKLDDGRTL
jgi:hypothetical protein